MVNPLLPEPGVDPYPVRALRRDIANLERAMPGKGISKRTLDLLWSEKAEAVHTALVRLASDSFYSTWQEKAMLRKVGLPDDREALTKLLVPLGNWLTLRRQLQAAEQDELDKLRKRFPTHDRHCLSQV